MTRDDKGRFVKGVSGNPGGRKPMDVPITDLIDNAVSVSDWQDIIKKLRDMAKRGNLKAVEILMDRRFGKALQKTEMTGADGTPLTVKVIKGVSMDDL